VAKRGLGINVLEAAQSRISYTFDHFQKIYLSFSGGKDSTVMLHLVMNEAKKRNRKVGLLFIDLEAQYKITIDHVENMFKLYEGHIDPYWISLPLKLRNAVSVYDPHWMCWDPERKKEWVRTPPKIAITDAEYFPFFNTDMEFEEFVDDFGFWYGEGKQTACFVGIRSDESLNRFRTIAAEKSKYNGLTWTTWKGKSLYNSYPIYDWRTEDIWTYQGKFGKPYNKL
jgi:predicted phosphoadenosine phosphosulfate sulfurtransferase